MNSLLINKWDLGKGIKSCVRVLNLLGKFVIGGFTVVNREYILTRCDPPVSHKGKSQAEQRISLNSLNPTFLIT